MLEGRPVREALGRRPSLTIEHNCLLQQYIYIYMSNMCIYIYIYTSNNKLYNECCLYSRFRNN